MDTQGLINVLAWGLVGVGGLLLSSLIWFARRSVSQLDKMQNMISRLLLRVALLERNAGIRNVERDSDVADS